VAGGPQWRGAAVVLNYDESGGFYDHVPPVSLGGATSGFRVPCTVVSPYARPGHVSHAVHDHASVLALIEHTFGLAPLGSRDASASPLADCFDFAHPDLSPVAFPAAPARPVSGCSAPPAWAADLLARPIGPAPAAGHRRGAGVAIGAGGLAAGLLGGAALGLGGAALGLRWRARRDRQ